MKHGIARRAFSPILLSLVVAAWSQNDRGGRLRDSREVGQPESTARWLSRYTSSYRESGLRTR